MSQLPRQAETTENPLLIYLPSSLIVLGTFTSYYSSSNACLHDSTMIHDQGLNQLILYPKPWRRTICLYSRGLLGNRRGHTSRPDYTKLVNLGYRCFYLYVSKVTADVIAPYLYSIRDSFSSLFSRFSYFWEKKIISLLWMYSCISLSRHLVFHRFSRKIRWTIIFYKLENVAEYLH